MKNPNDQYPHLFLPRVYRSEVYSTSRDEVTVEIDIKVPVKPSYSSTSIEDRANSEVTWEL